MSHQSIAQTPGLILAALTLATCYKTCPGATTPVPATPAASAAPMASSAATVPAPAVATYSIKISPDWKAGQKFSYVADDVSVSADGPTSVHFEADGEVQALLPSGNPHKLAYTVKVVKVTGADIPKASLPVAGSKLILEFAANNKKTVTMDGKPIDPDVADLLEEVLWITIRNHTDQEIYGPKTPVAIGAGWPVNATALIDSHEDGDPQYDKVEGSLSLQSVDGAGDAQLAVVSGNLTVKGQSPPSDPGSFSGQIKFTASAPINRHGVYKEIMISTTTFTPPASVSSILTGGASTVKESVTQAITLP